MGIAGVLIAQSISFALMWLSVLIWIIYKNGLTISSRTVRILFKFGFPLIFAMSGDLIINTSGNYLLGYFNNLEEVALFSLAYKIAAISIMILIGPFQMAYEPFIFRHKENEDIDKLIAKISTYVLFAYIFVCVGILVLFKDLIRLIGHNEYNDAYYLLFLLLPGIGLTIFNYIGQSLLHFKNKTNLTGIIVLFSTLISLLFSYFLIKYQGTIGLIISLNFYLFISSFLLLFYGMKEVKIKLELKRLLIISFIGLGLFIAIYYLSFTNGVIFYPISLLLFSGSLIFLYLSSFFDFEEKEKFRILMKKVFLRAN
jgi:O-antigen/teichoic acid export membrane protein